MVPNKVLRLFSKKQEDNVDHSYIRKPHKVEWTKPHETKESNHRTRPLIPARFDDFDPSGNGKRHRSTPLSVDPRRYPAIGYDHRRNNSSDYKWNYSERTLVDKQFNANFGKEQYMNETFKKNYYYKTDYQQISPTLNPNAYTIINSDSKPILNSNSKPIVNNESILNIDENAKPIVNNTKTKPIMIVNAKHQNAKYSQTNQQTFEPLSPNSKQTLTSILDTTIKSKDDQYSDFLPGTCPTCKGPIPEAGYYTQWCSACQSKLFEKKFGSWSSGNDDIDMFILETQLSSPSRFDYLEWIPFDKFKEVRFVGSGGYGNVYHAIWLDGPREKWDAKTVRYIRRSKQNVVLRSFNNLNIGSELFAELGKFLNSENNSGVYVSRYYGITQDPFTNNFMMVVQYARDGDLRKYYKQNFASMTWRKKLDILYGVAIGLTRIHQKDIIHRNLHSGNVLMNSSMTLLSDLRFPILLKDDKDINDGIYGVLPYIAPEILRNQPSTKESDVYSFGIMMWELAFGKLPFSDRAHNLDLATDICKGVHPEFEYELPECYSNLIKRCLDLDPLARPTAQELYWTLGEWLCMVDALNSDIAKQFREADENLLNNSPFSNEIHPEAVYTSRRYNFKCLEMPTIIFTNTNDRKERLAVRQYMANETKLYNIKSEMIRAENSDIAAEVYEILAYW